MTYTVRYNADGTIAHIEIHLTNGSRVQCDGDTVLYYPGMVGGTDGRGRESGRVGIVVEGANAVRLRTI